MSEGKYRAVLAYILVSDIASTAHADTALHAHLKREDDPSEGHTKSRSFVIDHENELKISETKGKF